MLNNYFSAAVDSLCFLTVPCTSYEQLCTVDLGTCNCFEKAPSDFPDLFLWLFVCSSGCIKQALLRGHPKKQI